EEIFAGGGSDDAALPADGKIVLLHLFAGASVLPVEVDGGINGADDRRFVLLLLVEILRGEAASDLGKRDGGAPGGVHVERDAATGDPGDELVDERDERAAGGQVAGARIEGGGDEQSTTIAVVAGGEERLSVRVSGGQNSAGGFLSGLPPAFHLGGFQIGGLGEESEHFVGEGGGGRGDA